MTTEEIQETCKSLPAVTEDIKWGHDLCFSIGNKMFLVIGIDNSPTTSSFKVTDEEFEEMSSRDGFMPAPYLARYKWVHVDNINRLTKKEWRHYIRQSYELIKSKLPKKIIKQLGV